MGKNEKKMVNHYQLLESCEIMEYIGKFYRYSCDTLFPSRTGYLYTFKYDGDNTIASLSYLIRLYRIASKKDILYKNYGMVDGVQDELYLYQREIMDYETSFETSYFDFLKKVEVDPKYYQEVVFSEIINFPHGHNLIPYYNLKYPILTIYPDGNDCGDINDCVNIDQDGYIDITGNLKFLGSILGRNYCAWGIALDFQVLYEPLFKKHYELKVQLTPDSENTDSEQSAHQLIESEKKERKTLTLQMLEDEIMYYAREEEEFIQHHKKDKENLSRPQTVSKQPKPRLTLTKEFIINELESIDANQKWEYAFTNEADYHTFLNLIVDYFDVNPYTLPTTVIKLKRDCKTRLAKTINVIHKQLSELDLKPDTEYFKIIRVLNHFKDLTDAQIYSSLTK